MKLPKIFILEKSLETKTEELLVPKDPKKVDVTFSDYTQIRYTTEGTSWAIDYEEEKKWVSSNKEFGEQKWFKDDKLDKLAETILKNRINPLVELLNLKEKDYSIENDNFRTILDRHATKVLESTKGLEDKKHGKCYTFLYEKGNLMIELKEYDRIHLEKMYILEG